MSVPDSAPISISPSPRRARLAPVLALMIGLLAALAAWGVGQRVAGSIPHALKLPGMPSTADFQRQNAAFAWAQSQTAAVVFAVLGGVLALGLGLLGGWVRASHKAAVGWGVVGLVLAPVAAAGLTMAIFPRFVDTFDPNTVSPAIPFLTYGGYWGLVGLVVGAVFGLARGGGVRHVVHAALGGAIGGVLGGVLLQLVGGLLFPLDKTIEPFAMEGITKATGSWSRLTGRLLTALPIALGATGLHASPSKTLATAPTLAEPASEPS